MPRGEKYKFGTFFTQGQYETQVETLEVAGSNEGVLIGVLKEDFIQENRVALVPNSIRTIAGYGHSIVVESGSGEKARYSDDDYAAAGAKVTKSKAEVFKCEIIIKSSPLSVDEINQLSAGQIVFTMLPLPLITKEYLEKLKEKYVIALAFDYLQNQDGSFPVLRIMGEIAGRIAIQTASELLSIHSGGRGVLLGGVSGVPPAKVLILGAGVVGQHATQTALALGASVRIFDNDIDKIIRLQDKIGRQLHTSSINPQYLAYQLTSADVVISAMHGKKGRAPVLVSEEMVSNMKEGSIIIDVSIDQGGCIETSEMTTHKKSTFVKHGVIHYCVPNMASKVPRTSSLAISNVITPAILGLASSTRLVDLLYGNQGLLRGIYVYDGHITNQYLANHFELKYTALELLLTSSQ
jgi:alanine dehydrogenase